MTVSAEFELGEAYREVAVIPAADVKARLLGAWRLKLDALDGLCAGADPKRLLGHVFAMIRVAAGDLDAAVDSLDVEAISDARRAETHIWQACQVILAAVDFDGRRPPEPALLKQIANAAEDVVRIGSIRADAWGKRRRIHDLQARMQGRRLVATFRLNDTFDARMYELALAGDWLEPRGAADHDTIAEALRAVETGGPLPDELRQADLLLASTYRVSLRHFLRTAQILNDHPNDATIVFRSRRDDLVTQVFQRLGDRTAADAALRLFTTDIDQLRLAIREGQGALPRTGIARWQPLVAAPDNHYFYAPGSFGTRFQVSYLKGVLNGSWPVELPAGPWTAYLTSRRRRIRPKHDFEARVRAEVELTRFAGHSAANVEPSQAIERIGIAVDREIDVVAADPERGLVWVISAKDSEQVHEDSQVKNQLVEFYGGNRDRIGSKSHVAILHGQVTLIAENASAVAQHLGVADSANRTWRTRGLFVTRVPSVAAADRRRTYPIVLLSQLRNYLENPPDLAPEHSPEASALLRRIG